MRKDREGIEDLYSIRSPSKAIYIILAVAFVAIVVFWLFSITEKPINEEAITKACEETMLKSNSKYTVCCVQDNSLVDCSNREIFEYNDYVIVEANLLLLDTYFPTYHACAFYTPLETSLEAKGGIELPEFNVGEESVICTERLRNVYHHVENFGYIKNHGKITLMRLYAFPPSNYNTTKDFVDNMGSGILILDLIADVT